MSYGSTISVVTAWHNQPQLIPAFESAVRGARVVIINQASDEQTTTALCDMVDRLGERSTIIHNIDNAPIARAFNQGLHEVTSAITVFLNNDIHGAAEPMNAWLAQVARDVTPGGLYGPMVHSFPVDGIDCPFVDGWCVAGYTDFFKQIGGWDAVNFPKCYAEDVELSYRARKHGAELFQTRWPIQHIGNVTSRSVPGAFDAADGQRERFREMVRADRRATA